MAHGLSCFAAGGILLDEGLNTSLLHWQADSFPLSHQGSPPSMFRLKNVSLLILVILSMGNW